MKKAPYFTILFFTVLFNPAMAQEAAIFPIGEKAPNVHHVGNVWVNELSEPDSIFNYNMTVATFEPDARLDWHIHPAGQILMITDGTGFYQEKGKPKEVVNKGDVVKCLPGVEHWHGASPEKGFTYLATTPQKRQTIWGRRVTDEEYYGSK